MESFTISYADLCTKLLEYDKDKTKFKLFLEQSYINLSEPMIDSILDAVYKRFYAQLKRRWLDSNHTKSRFENKYAKWLQGVFKMEKEISNDMSEPSTSSKPGRPRKSFDECCDRTKRYKRDEVRAMFPQEVIDFASTTSESKTKLKICTKKRLVCLQSLNSQKQNTNI